MSRFCFCNCPAGFSADPERHAPDCPGRSGAGKTRTPVPATTPALTVSAAEELDAVLHWRDKHTQAIRERDALQQRLTAADERIDVMTIALTRIHDRAEAFIDDGMHMPTPSIEVIRDIAARAALKPAEGGGDEFAHDRAYRNGLMQGYNLALNGSEEEYQEAVSRYSGGKDAE